MNKKELLVILMKRAHISIDAFVDMLLDKNLEDGLGDYNVEFLEKSDNKERKLRITNLVSSLKSENELWIWNALVKFAHHRPIDPILYDLFVLPVLREEIKGPKNKKKSKGRPPMGKSKKIKITQAVGILRKDGHTLREACDKVARKLNNSRDDSSSAIEKAYLKGKKEESDDLIKDLNEDEILEFVEEFKREFL